MSSGISTVVTPARWAARIFSLRPPIGSTRPRSVTSPVIAMVWRTGMRSSALAIAVAIVMPALGPSLGIAPSGKWTWTSILFWKSFDRPNVPARERR